MSECATADEAEVEKSPDILYDIIEEDSYSKEQIFSTDETGLQQKRIPESTHVFWQKLQARDILTYC